MEHSGLGGVVAADIGGTFTDMLLAEGGTLRSVKIPSSPPRFGQAITEGIKLLLGLDHVVETDRLDTFLHGATVATNALLENKGSATALVTTKGFRDVLEIGRTKRPTVLSVRWRKTPPLVPRHLRFEVTERIGGDGSIVTPCSVDEVRALAGMLRSAGVDSVAVCFINSYVNPEHEALVASILRQELPGVFVTASTEIVPELREYERTSTTVVNGYVGPVVGNYIAEIQQDIEVFRAGARFRIMQSNGGLTGPDGARAEPVRLIESGPAAGVTAATLVARSLGESRVLAFDMGGTTAKVSLIEDFRPAEVMEFEVGAGMNSSHSGGGGGYPIRVPSVDIVEVGAGGGSIFWIDAAGQPHVGPHSAGAVPGPVSY
ncbi:MAG: N-methylhydantoinase, partial [Acidimicrobiia bacterium]|nr:N-methylhydantoinase [Acidimicrobiia bacterium]